jgi:CheY-like chemotaxis protein
MAMATEKRASVLLVEDEPDISLIAAEALAEQGFDVHTVATASEALHCLSEGEPIDILFTDINLPGDMDGAALAQAARALRPGLPVMYTSGRRHAIEHLNPIECSMFVAKPYNPFDVGRLLDYLMAAQEITARLKTPLEA